VPGLAVIALSAFNMAHSSLMVALLICQNAIMRGIVVTVEK
jgi:hypothetical protein